MTDYLISKILFDTIVLVFGCYYGATYLDKYINRAAEDRKSKRYLFAVFIWVCTMLRIIF